MQNVVILISIFNNHNHYYYCMIIYMIYKFYALTDLMFRKLLMFIRQVQQKSVLFDNISTF